VNPISHWFSSQWKSFSTVVFQYPIRYTILHVVCTSTWSLAPFIQHFHNNCTMDNLKNPTEIQLFILQDKLQLLGMVQFCCFCTLWKYWELSYYPTRLQCYNEINNCCLCNIFTSRPRASRAAGLVLRLLCRFRVCISVYLYICASALITCAIIRSRTLLPCDLTLVDLGN